MLSRRILLIKASRFLSHPSILQKSCTIRAASGDFNFEDLLKIVKQQKHVEKKPTRHRRNESYSADARNNVIHVISNGSFGFGKSVYIDINMQRCFFNSAEGVFRTLASKRSVYPNNGNHNLFTTRRSWSTIGGLLSMCFGWLKESIVLHSPFNLEKLINKGYYTLRLNSLNLRSHDYDKEPRYQDVHFAVTAITLRQANVDNSGKPPSDDDGQSSFTANIDELSIDTRKGWLKSDVESCANKSDANRVYAYLLELNGEPTSILVLDCPDESYIDFVVNYKRPKSLKYIVHLSPSNVLREDRYVKWIKRNLDVNHLMVDEALANYDVNQFYKFNKALNRIDGEMFPLLKDETDDLDDFYTNTLRNDNVIPGYQSVSVQILTGDWIQDWNRKLNNFGLASQEFKRIKETIKTDLKKIEEKKLKDNADIYPQVVFFGTGSTVPRANRNATGILVNLTDETSVILDCGEGTMGQMIRHYGVDSYKNELRKVKAIFISHFHGDHHLGLMGILEERRRLKLDEQLLYICLSENVLIWLNPLFELFKDTRPNKNVRLMLNQVLNPSYIAELDLFIKENPIEKTEHADSYKSLKVKKIMKIKERVRDLLALLNVQEFSTTPVIHTPFSFGCKIVTNNNFSLVYSSDCRPSRTLIDHGMNCDLLIHESTFDENGAVVAKTTQHSTVKDAIDVAKNMKAKNVILTHFGKDLNDVSRIFNNFSEPTSAAIAFDHMVVNKQTVHKAPIYNQAIDYLFQFHRNRL